MILFEQEEKNEEIDFIRIENKFKEMIKPYNGSESFDLAVLIEELIKLEKVIINKVGKHKNRVENNILSSICVFYFDIISEFKFVSENLDEFLIAGTLNQEYKKVHVISLEILKLIELIFEFKMKKDNFSSKRKAHAIGLFCSLLRGYQIRNENDIYRSVLKSNNDILLIRFFEEMNILFQEFDKKLPEDIIQMLYQLINKTKNRSVVVGCLDFLCTLNRESEGTALFIIDDWKERNLY